MKTGLSMLISIAVVVAVAPERWSEAALTLIDFAGTQPVTLSQVGTVFLGTFLGTLGTHCQIYTSSCSTTWG